MKKLMLILSLALCAAFFGCQTEKKTPEYKLQKIDKLSTSQQTPPPASQTK